MEQNENTQQIEQQATPANAETKPTSIKALIRVRPVWMPISSALLTLSPIK